MDANDVLASAVCRIDFSFSSSVYISTPLCGCFRLNLSLAFIKRIFDSGLMLDSLMLC